MANTGSVISHWDQLIENFQTSPMEFYQAVEAAIERRRIPDRQSIRVDFKEGGLLTAKREYLRVMRGKHSFDICAAPFGTGFFFSWWLVELPSQWFAYFAGLVFAAFVTLLVCLKAGFFTGLVLSMIIIPVMILAIGAIVRENGGAAEDAVLAMPFIGAVYQRIFNPPTYFKTDSALMFQQAVHNAVLEVIDQITSPKGIRMLSEFERKPILKSFAQSA